MPIFRSRGRWRWNISTISGRSFRVVGSPPEMLRFSTAPQNGWVEDRLELGERHVRLAIAPLPVVAHRALGVADPGAVVDEHRRPDRVELGADEGIDEVARDTRRGFREVMQPEACWWPSGDGFHGISRAEVRANLKDRRQRICALCLQLESTTGPTVVRGSVGPRAGSRPRRSCRSIPGCSRPAGRARPTARRGGRRAGPGDTRTRSCFDWCCRSRGRSGRPRGPRAAARPVPQVNFQKYQRSSLNETRAGRRR